MIDTEQAILAACLASPDKLAEAVAVLTADDFEHPFHGVAFAALAELQAANRSPSVEALVARFGDQELEDDLSVREYLRKLYVAAVNGEPSSFRDGVEVLRDQAMRRSLVDAAMAMQAGAQQGASVSDLAAKALAEIDTVLSAMRSGKSNAYAANDAATFALEHMDSPDQELPKSGLSDLDRITGGWPRGEFTVIAGRPGMGKSAVATGVLLNAARAGHNSLFFSLEMTKKQLGARLLTDLAWSHASPIEYEDLLQRRQDKLTEHVRRRLNDAARRLDGLPMRIEEQRGLTIAEIAARSRKHANELARQGKRLDLIAVDHMLLVAPSQRYSGNRVQEVREISNGLATLAKELDLSMIGLCQLNRGVEGRDNKRPGMSDLRDSGSIEEDASLIVFLYRAAYYLAQKREDDPDAEALRVQALEASRNKLEFIVAKNRNGRCGVVDAFCDIGSNAIRNGASYGH